MATPQLCGVLAVRRLAEIKLFKEKSVADKRTKKKASSKKSTAKQQASKKQPRGLRLFFRETMGELKKVSWPTREEAVALTRVVIIVMVIMALVLGGLDTAFFRFFDFVFKI
jgi:preprotein translocase subunit SecE